jgi:hypothetical protein
VADPLYYAFLDEIASEAIPWHAGTRGEHFTLDSVSSASCIRIGTGQDGARTSTKTPWSC